MSGWVRVFAIKMLSIIFPLKSNPWKIISHFKKTKKRKEWRLKVNYVLNCLLSGAAAELLRSCCGAATTRNTIIRFSSSKVCCAADLEHLCWTGICGLSERKGWARIDNKPHHTQGLIPSIHNQLSQIVWPLILLIPLGKLMWHCAESRERQTISLSFFYLKQRGIKSKK